MSPGLEDVISPVRDIAVASLLEALAEALATGDEVEAEPVARGQDGRPLRGGSLHLPWRHDIATRRGGVVEAASSPLLHFRPMSLGLARPARARIAPFQWTEAPLRLGRPARAPDWAPARLWVLEWFQPRFGEESPDLSGVAHRLDGPRPDGDGWRFTVDLGSAPVAGFAAMVEAMGRCGCADIAVGEGAIAA